MLRSSLCREVDFRSEWYNKWCNIIKNGLKKLDEEEKAVWQPVWDGMSFKCMHRKLWEWCAISEALEERGMLVDGREGIGFAVGKEPLASMFASYGPTVTATDYPSGDIASQWNESGQLAKGIEDSNWPGLISHQEFQDRVKFRPVDMNRLSVLDSKVYDFMWSSCSFEHLGSLEAGINFVCNSLELLQPGGLAVHTTEYNVSSNEDTIKNGDSVIYRRRDIEALDRRLRLQNAAIENLDFEAGSEPNDIGYDYPPYYSHNRQHIKLKLGDYISTSILLIIRKY
ncbi:methyltransferase type 11 [Synechococcus sp. CS-1324]|uniref:hypothetical protein n=1 Tax=Synechococcus sp. CS-1324 TaxID=2847980 RepID=UPI00223C23C2|nr:hypothetical protein [Synechococcus sp. CS-1324]MCT0229474.1 methyltransferase type 11 [Synechococcus sp. CS-1324]